MPTLVKPPKNPPLTVVDLRTGTSTQVSIYDGAGSDGVWTGSEIQSAARRAGLYIDIRSADQLAARGRGAVEQWFYNALNPTYTTYDEPVGDGDADGDANARVSREGAEFTVSTELLLMLGALGLVFVLGKRK